MSFFLLGPINSGDTVALTHQEQDKLYVLNTFTDTQGNTEIFFDSNVKGIIESGAASVPSFKVTGSNPNVLLQGSTTALSWDADFNAGLATVGREFIQSQNTYQPWNPPAVSLAGVTYFLVTPDNHPIIFRLGESTATGPTFNGATSNTAQYLSQNWFFCTDGNCQENETVLGSITSDYCSQTNDPTICSTVQTSGFTQLSDASLGVRYQYCALGNFCSSNCNGPCSSSLDVCQFTSNTGQFACSFSPSTNNIFEQPWFIVSAIVIFVLVILLLIVLYLRRRQS